jgi:hypothetical protein
MDVSELMIGDWIYQKHHRRYERWSKADWFVQANGHILDRPVMGKDIEPIPLKRIHLTKNGFRAVDDSDCEFVYKDGYKISVIFMDGETVDGVELSPFISLSVTFAEKDLWMQVEYVHQLQHALKLLEVDKDIVL